MKVYYICEYCEKVFNISEVGGQEGVLELRGICDECALEMGLKEEHYFSNLHYYN